MFIRDLKMGKGKGGLLKSCANSLHDEWGSSSQHLICIKRRIKEVKDFLMAFDVRERVTHGLFCIDCLTACWSKPTYISRLPDDYKTMPAYTMVCHYFLFNTLRSHFLGKIIAKFRKKWPFRISLSYKLQHFKANLCNTIFLDLDGFRGAAG